MNRKLPIHCTPCRVTFAGARYQIETNGEVRLVPYYKNSGVLLSPENVRRIMPPMSETSARIIRREASRQRRNRNARERAQAKRDLGLVRAPGGAFGGWE